MMRAAAFTLLGIALGACASDAPPGTQTPTQLASGGPSAAPSVATAPQPPRVISVVGTNDLHGRVAALPLLGGYLANLRQARSADGGVVLVDAGDMYQGTLESNLLEGKPIRDAYAVLRYDAVTIGNHEFDYGPVGPAATPESSADDPRGALLALSNGAPYPFLAANLLQQKTKSRVEWPNVKSRVAIDVAGVKVGLVGVTTEETLETTIAPNVKDLMMAPLASSIEAEAKALRGDGAEMVVVLAHAGGKCQAFRNDLSQDACETDAEIFRAARALPTGLVDVIVAGHTHAGVAHEVNGIAIIEQFSYGRAFGRVDVKLGGQPRRVESRKLHAPQDLCPGQGNKPEPETCDAGEYEGKKVERLADVHAAIAPAIDAAKGKRAAVVGTELEEPIRRSYDQESALGNLFADLLLAAVKDADAALMNGGGLRADLPKGKLSYGALFESFPFDNRLAVATMGVGRLKSILEQNLKSSGGVLSIAGLNAKAVCEGSRLKVILKRKDGSVPADSQLIRVVASDFMVLGGDGFWGQQGPAQYEVLTELMRDALERGLAAKKSLRERDVFNAKKPRLEISQKRPLKCP